MVINTYNEEANIKRAIRSVKWADEVVVCDMHSQDKTVEIAKKLGAQVIYHKYTSFVEPARNFAINACTGEWILILDADEQVPPALAIFLRNISKQELHTTYLSIPRRNIVFGRWMRATMWWPDYNVRFFKKGTVEWSDKIHSKPRSAGVGMSLPEEAKYAIIHDHYSTVSQFLERLNRYSTIQAEELISQGVKFKWSDLIIKPVDEFFSRFFAHRGFDDGVHGLALSLLQATSFLVVYLKIWEKSGFNAGSLEFSEVKSLMKNTGEGFKYWFKYANLPSHPIKRLIERVKAKFQ